MQSLAFSDALVVISGKRDMLNTAAVRPAIGILVAAGVVLVALVVLSPHRFVYDEPYFVEYIALLHKFGPTPAFLNALTGTVGPLYAFVQAAFEPITGLQPTGMRLVNVFLLLVVIAILIAWL
ncbi:MAG: hypothetical protein PSV46_17145, partial [Reyranella sp.]|nr:hypothetical protein [Reyranella sp.]